MRYLARTSFRYGNKIYLRGDIVVPALEDVRMLQGQGKIGGAVRETAMAKPPETAVLPEAEPKHLGGGWYELPDGRKVRKKDL